MSKFAMAFNIGATNEERKEAFEMYRQAFDAKMISETLPPDGGDVHIVMDLDGTKVLLAPGGKVEKTVENPMCCEFHFDNESDLRKAYDILSAQSMRCSMEGPYPWATLLGLVVDKFGVCWALYYNE